MRIIVNSKNQSQHEKKCLTNLQGGYLCDIIHIEKEKERMLKKLFLTGIFVVSTSVPVLSYGDYITNSSSCNYATLNTYTSANLSAVFEPNNYTITYSCGSAPQGSASTPSSPTTSSSTFAMDTTYTLAAAYNCSLPGYTFAGWSCPYLPGTPTLPAGNPQYFAGGATGTYSYAGNITCTAQWTPNDITLHWDGAYTGAPNINDSSCEYDGGITLPTPPPSRTGYTFGGWRVHEFELREFYLSSASIGTDYQSSGHNATNYNLTQNNTWAVELQNGVLRGTSYCSSVPGTYAQPAISNASVTNLSGTNCWCAATDFGDSFHVANPTWIFYRDGYSNATQCNSDCPGKCAYRTSEFTDFRQAIFGVTTP